MSYELIEEIVNDLRVLGQVRSGDKLYTDGGRVRISRCSNVQGISRFWTGEGREKNHHFLKRRITDAVKLCKLLDHYNTQNDMENRENRQRVIRLKESLKISIEGLVQLGNTYRADGDDSLSQYFEELKENIQDFLKESNLDTELNNIGL